MKQELVNLADYFNDAPDSHASVAINVPKQRTLVVTALRRLASSDGGVKVRELEWGPYPNSVLACDDVAVADVAVFGGHKYQVQRDPNAAGYIAFLAPQFGSLFWESKNYDTLDAAKAAAQADYETRIRSALVEVPAVKGEPEPVASERISQLAADLVVSGWTAGDHGIELAKRRAERKLLEFACDEIERHMRSHTAPPVDAGMREALDNSQSLLVMVNHIGPKPELWETEEMSTLLVEQIMENRAALTTPGATTKSDGGDAEIPSRLQEAIDDTRGNMDRALSKLPKLRATSDPSSTRSDVTALAKRLDQVLKVMRGARNRSEPMAVWADDIKAVEDARALLDQFEIRRK